MNPSSAILESWQANAENWIQTIEHQEIESRQLVTNQAILQAVDRLQPSTALDVGCGEGWLTRALSEQGIDVLGVDGIPALIENARAKGSGKYRVASYRDIYNGYALAGQFFDVIVINFALIDKDDTDSLILYLPAVLKTEGHLLIQTLHPLGIMQQSPYQSGWQPGSWNGMKRDFVQPYDWYFRTLGDWIDLFNKSGLILQRLIEPLHPNTQQPASIIFMLKPKA